MRRSRIPSYLGILIIGSNVLQNVFAAETRYADFLLFGREKA
jgi:hypothetical protein